MSRFAPAFTMASSLSRTSRVLETVGIVLVTVARLFGIWV